MTTVVSGFHPAAYKQYARSFLETFDYYWPKDIEMAVYVEEFVEGPPRIEQRSLWRCHGQREFIEAHLDNLAATGRKASECWTNKALKDLERNGYCYRYDAVRFSRQLFIPEHAVAQMDDGDIMAWFDADVVAFDHVPTGFIDRLLGHTDLVSLGREGASTELGFWAIRVNDRTRLLVHRLAEACRSGHIFTLQEWHSGYVFDRMVEWGVREGLVHRNLTKDRQGHVWFKCDLGKYTDHLKGERRKKLGKSLERDGSGLRQGENLNPVK
jgi:hypothetical protein